MVKRLRLTILVPFGPLWYVSKPDDFWNCFAGNSCSIISHPTVRSILILGPVSVSSLVRSRKVVSPMVTGTYSTNIFLCMRQFWHGDDNQPRASLLLTTIKNGVFAITFYSSWMWSASMSACSDVHTSSSTIWWMQKGALWMPELVSVKIGTPFSW